MRQVARAVGPAVEPPADSASEKVSSVACSDACCFGGVCAVAAEGRGLGHPAEILTTENIHTFKFAGGRKTALSSTGAGDDRLQFLDVFPGVFRHGRLGSCLDDPRERIKGAFEFARLVAHHAITVMSFDEVRRITDCLAVGLPGLIPALESLLEPPDAIVGGAV